MPARNTYNFGLVAMALALIVIAFGPGPGIAISAGALLGFGFSFPWSSVAATVLKRTPERERGSTVGVLSAFYDLFVGISSFAAGEVSSRFGYPAAFAMAAASIGAAAVAGLFVFGARSGDSALADTPEPALDAALD
jgi:predicted MFS family arabinose efflux permease